MLNSIREISADFKQKYSRSCAFFLPKNTTFNHPLFFAKMGYNPCTIGDFTPINKQWMNKIFDDLGLEIKCEMTTDLNFIEENDQEDFQIVTLVKNRNFEGPGLYLESSILDDEQKVKDISIALFCSQ